MIVKWAFLALSFLAATNAEIFIGPLITKAHLVGGDVYLLSDKVLEIRNYVYDGDGPAAFFWADTNPNPTRQGRVIPDASPSLGCNLNAQGTALPRAQGITQRVEFPEGESFQDYLGGSLSVWCEAFNANFGHVSFPSSIDSSALTAVATECVFTEVEPIAAAIATTPDAYNCEPMNDRFQVRWSVDGNDLHVELVGRIEDGTYMGFGISGSSTETWMLGADAVVVDYVDGQPRATDIFIDSRAQCNGETGVCPDSTMGFTNDISNVSGEQDCGVTLVRYTRPLTPSDLTMLMGLQGDAPVDKTIDVTPGVETFIVWAQGSISNVGNPLFHNIGYARQDGKSVSLDFGRAPQDNCSPLCTIDGTPAPTMVPPPPFHRPFIGDTDDTTVFDCHIGPSGGPRGYAAITEEASWGIAWYCNDLLIPKLTLRRGTTYTFRINGGDNQADDANYHPFYLTTNPVGGYLQQTPKERLKETPLLGINILEDSPEDGVTSFEPTLVAPICRYEKTQATTEEVELGDFEDYFETLDTSCADDSNIVDNAAVATFTPDETTPDTIYYHCVTHYNLGFEIEVLDSDDPKITPAPTAVPIDTDGFKSTDLPGDLDGASLLYKVNYEDERASGQDTASFILVAPTTSWVGFAFSTTGLMLGSEAVIGTPETGEVLKYSLNAQSVSGVVPMSAGKQTLIEARITQDGSVTTLEFTKILVEEGEIPIGDEGENTFLGAWGFGNALNAPHQKRGPFIIDLAGSGEAVEGGGVDTSSLWKAHGFLLALAWGGATPLAIGASLIRKLLPGNTLWFQIHMAFNILSVTLTIIGVIIAIVAINKQTPDGSKAGHFDPSVDKHRLIGLIVFIFAVIQAIGGLARPRLPPSNDKPDDEEEQAPSAEKSKARKAWEIGHRLFGVGLLGLCWAQVHLGIERYNLINGLSPDSMLAAFWSIVGIIAGFSLLGKGYSMTKKED